MRALDYGAVVVEGVDVGGIGCCFSRTSNEGGHVCIGNKSGDTAVACTRRQQQQNSCSERSGTVTTAAAKGQQQQQQQQQQPQQQQQQRGGRRWGKRGWIVRWIP